MYYTSGELDAAITEYYRHIYLHPDDEEIREVYIKLGNALRDSGKQPESLRALSMALQRSTTQLSRAQTRLELATAHLLFDQPLQAQLVLFRILASPPADSTITSRAHLLLGVSNVLAQQWSDASKNLARWADSKPSRLALRDSLAILLADTTEIPHRSPTLAKVMSAVIPGSGQIYCGEYLDGLNALLLNGAVIWTGYTQIMEKRHLAAVLVGVPLVGRYYMGNLDHAERYANEFNDRARRGYAARVIRQIADLSD
jgi:tetratricopeptide (TPR) repeat protein